MAALLDRGADQNPKTQQWKEWDQVAAAAQSQANAAQLQSNPAILSGLEELIAARIGRAVRHVRSETVLKFWTNAHRTGADRRAYTKHWLEPSGTEDGRLRPGVGEDGLLVVFVKSATQLQTCAPLELLLSNQPEQGFRAPYFFGSFSTSGLKVAAWEFIDVPRVPFQKYPFRDQKRIVEAIAAINATKADGTVPSLTRWIDVSPSWFESKIAAMGDMAGQWQQLHLGTLKVLSYQDSLSRRLRSAGESCLTHNDIGIGASNVFAPPVGDVILFDWDLATLSIPGADLGLITRMSSRDHLISCYVARMAQYGYRLHSEEVGFTADVLQGFRFLQTGWRLKSLRIVAMGLKLLAPHLEGAGPVFAVPHHTE